MADVTSDKLIAYYKASRDKAEAEADRLEAINAELLRALDNILPWAGKAVADHYNEKIGKRALVTANEAIKKARGESCGNS